LTVAVCSAGAVESTTKDRVALYDDAAVVSSVAFARQ
jgi:hypothetical protein